jgi:ABC-type transport system substrate-binding protein
MRRIRAVAGGCLAIVLLLGACAPAQRPAGSEQGGESAGAPGAARAPVRVVAAITGNPPAFVTWLSATGLRGIDAVQDLLTTGLAGVDNTGVVQPRLAETVPSIDNGLWVVHTDGRMETTWKIRPGATWHDGAPFTAEDVLFTTRVQRPPGTTARPSRLKTSSSPPAFSGTGSCPSSTTRRSPAWRT